MWFMPRAKLFFLGRSMIGSFENYEKFSQSTWEVLEEQWNERVPNGKLCLTQLIAVSKDC